MPHTLKPTDWPKRYARYFIVMILVCLLNSLALPVYSLSSALRLAKLTTAGDAKMVHSPDLPITMTDWSGSFRSIFTSFLNRQSSTLAATTTSGVNGRLAFASDRSGNYDIFVINADGGGQTKLTTNLADELDPDWSPDGKKIVFMRGNSIANRAIYVMNADGTNQVALTDVSADNITPAWSPDGTRIAFASDRDGRYQIYVMNADGGSPIKLTTNFLDNASPTWSPDGTRIAYMSVDSQDVSEIYVMKADGSGQINLSNRPAADDVSPSWSPDSQKIVFASDRDGNYEIYVMNADGSSQTRVTNNAVEDDFPAWSPDGARIAFMRVSLDDHDEIYVMNADGNNAVNISNNSADDVDPAWESLLLATPTPTPTPTPAPTPTPTPSPGSPSVQFSQAGYSVGEGEGRATLTVTRLGDASAAVIVNYATDDSSAFVGCDVVGGAASARCDYSSSLDTLSFAAGETTRNIIVPIIDDAYSEGSETLTITLSNSIGGAALGAPSTATLTITDNDTGQSAANPINNASFFVRMQYIDFLSREPEQAGFDAWLGVLNRCGGGGTGSDPSCDRVAVSSSFFRSDEFQFKGYFVYRFYTTSFGRRPTYAEIIQDMRRVTGQTGEEVIAKRDAFAARWVERADFRARYDALSNAAFVDALLLTAKVQTAIRDTLISDLEAGRKTRGQVLRAIVESPEVNQREYNGAFVAMQYFGYLRRDPEPEGYAAWLQVIERNPADYRTMVHGFATSVEYRKRFGQP